MQRWFASQTLGEAQSAVDAHVVRHFPFDSHWKGVQSIVVPFGFCTVFCPSHVAASLETHLWTAASHLNSGAQSAPVAQIFGAQASPLQR